jgi:DegV family protein with EDD domain
MAVMRDNMQVYFAVKTLEYLAKGGRIGRASHLMGTMLDIKPLLTVTDGAIDAHSRFRTWKRAVEGLRELVLSEVPPPAGRDAGERLHMGVVHAVSEEEAQQLYDELSQALQPDVMLFAEIGPGLGVHVGPGALSVQWARVPG